MPRKDLIVAGLDIGTTTVRAVIARCHHEHGIRIIGAGTLPSEGVRKSVIVDSEEVVRATRAAVETAERDAGVEVDDLYVGISGGHINSCTAAAVVNILDGDETVHARHLAELLDKARSNSAEKGREFLHAIPQEYRLDGHTAEQSPVGLCASRIEATAHMITADRTILENHGRVVNDAGFRVLDICFNVIADGNSVLTDEEKKEGVLLVDIGGGSSGYAVYFNNTIYYSNVFAVGGDHITNDLMLGLHLSTTDAEQLKCSFSRLTRSETSDDPAILKMQTVDRKTKPLSRPDIEIIIDSRLEELLQFIRDDVDQRQYRPLLARGVVFVGGTTNLSHFAEKAEKIFTVPLRIAVPRIATPETKHGTDVIYSDRHEFLRDTSCATVLGLVKYGYRMQRTAQQKSRGLLSKFFSRS